MLYLIESFMRDEQDSPLRCLKIGYAKDVEDRLKTYRTHNPSVKLLKTREGEYELENYLHKYFKRYELPGHQEWFIYSKNIINEFERIEIQEETITIDEYLEHVRKEILKIIDKNYESLCIKIPELLEELEKEFNINSYGEEIYSEFPKDLCKERIKSILKFLERKEVEYFSSTDFSNIRMDFPQIMGRQRLKENVFRDDCTFIYKLSDNDVTVDKFEEISLKKILISQGDINNYNAIVSQDNTNCDSFRNDIRRRVLSLRYQDDYTAVQEKTGNIVINKLVYLAEKRAFELRSNSYKNEVTVYNEFSDIAGIEVSNDLGVELENSLSDLRYSLTHPGSFETKMRLLCEFLEKYSGYVTVYDIKGLNINFRNYILSLGPEKIRAKGYHESELKKELELLKSGDKIRDQFLNTFNLGQTYSLKEAKEMIRSIYLDLGLSKTPKATDLEEFFNLMYVGIYEKHTKKRVKGYRILSLK